MGARCQSMLTYFTVKCARPGLYTQYRPETGRERKLSDDHRRVKSKSFLTTQTCRVWRSCSETPSYTGSREPTGPGRKSSSWWRVYTGMSHTHSTVASTVVPHHTVCSTGQDPTAAAACWSVQERNCCLFKSLCCHGAQALIYDELFL